MRQSSSRRKKHQKVITSRSRAKGPSNHDATPRLARYAVFEAWKEVIIQVQVNPTQASRSNEEETMRVALFSP
ncbi:unnamed protein product [Cochlearia groenlandica]